MKKTSIIELAIFLFAALASVGAAFVATNRIETLTEREVTLALMTAGQEWAHARADGLNVIISGTAPDEATRFGALGVASDTIEASRVIDETDVVPTELLEPPRFVVEILRNGPGISLIGLVPGQEGRAQILDALKKLATSATVTDMLDSAPHDAPEGWAEAIDYAMAALEMLPSAKVSVEAERVSIQAITNSPDEKLHLEAALHDMAPDNLELVLDIKAPRPVIAPYTLRFVLDEGGARFDSCTADSEVARSKILASARNAGLEGEADCVIGLGTPSPQWSDAAVRAITALSALGGGTVTFTDADISLIAVDSTPRNQFDDIAHGLEANLPVTFSLHATLPEPAEEPGEAGPQRVLEFIATRSPEGLVQLRGRLSDKAFQEAVNSFAQARFGADSVHDTTRIEPTLPDGWPRRVLAGLEGLARLRSGSLIVKPESLTLKGASPRQETGAEITQLLSGTLGQTERFDIDIRHEDWRVPVAELPKPAECVGEINEILSGGQITFAPGQSRIEASTIDRVTQIAAVMKKCAAVEMRIEIGGYTDSQGRESMNLALSQGRAEAVLDALLARGVLTTGMSAKGYGESRPIADNETEEGREANRRIEFRLILSDDPETADNEAAGAENEPETEPAAEAPPEPEPSASAAPAASEPPAAEAADPTDATTEGTHDGQE